MVGLVYGFDWACALDARGATTPDARTDASMSIKVKMMRRITSLLTSSYELSQTSSYYFNAEGVAPVTP
jgi:hypothetical protein